MWVHLPSQRGEPCVKGEAGCVNVRWKEVKGEALLTETLVQELRRSWLFFFNIIIFFNMEKGQKDVQVLGI